MLRKYPKVGPLQFQPAVVRALIDWQVGDTSGSWVTMSLATCSTTGPSSARPSRSAFSAAHVFGPQSISVTGPSVKT